MRKDCKKEVKRQVKKTFTTWYCMYYEYTQLFLKYYEDQSSVFNALWWHAGCVCHVLLLLTDLAATNKNMPHANGLEKFMLCNSIHTTNVDQICL